MGMTTAQSILKQLCTTTEEGLAQELAKAEQAAKYTPWSEFSALTRGDIIRTNRANDEMERGRVNLARIGVDFDDLERDAKGEITGVGRTYGFQKTALAKVRGKVAARRERVRHIKATAMRELLGVTPAEARKILDRVAKQLDMVYTWGS
jgi:hypothetical protein